MAVALLLAKNLASIQEVNLQDMIKKTGGVHPSLGIIGSAIYLQNICCFKLIICFYVNRNAGLLF